MMAAVGVPSGPVTNWTLGGELAAAPSPDQCVSMASQVDES